MTKKFNDNSKFLGLVVCLLTCTIFISTSIKHWPQNSEINEIKFLISRGETLTDISKNLYKMDIISNMTMFKISVQLKGLASKLPTGYFSLKNFKTNNDIIKQLVNGKPITKKVTILEGWSASKTVAHLSKTMNFEKNSLTTLLIDKKFLDLIDFEGNNLEGYLFPDTYYFFEGETPNSIVKRLYLEYTKFWNQEHLSQLKLIGMTKQDITTLASIIEGEAMIDTEREVISSVYHNRLRIGMKLQADPTVQYVIKDGPRRLLNKDLLLDSPYNTYMNKGLPPGPINSPGYKSLKAALYPSNDNYLYFVAREDGFHTFSKNKEEDLKAKKIFQKIRRKVKKEQSK